MNKKIAQFTNKEFLKELAERIVTNRLEVENCSNCQAAFTRFNSLTNLDILDNEWKDRSKPDYTGARTGLNYWLTEIRNQSHE